MQLYSCMIYAGPGLPAEIVKGLSALCDRDGLKAIRDIRDSRLTDWASRPI